ncbi:hypothetical protein QVD17_20027 [Tagetes erecta]|uniref:DUF382 domain-containing protein n=1 Tax=Tagetes erecta TaxID=13708 RepID=A0AAD8KQU9_TARER|nr:hypothetical protein QVD17_20027 [Tagetes erecta]
MEPHTNVDSKSTDNNKQTWKKSRDAERRRRRRKQKKNKSVHSAKENFNLQKVMEQVEIEYIPEKEFNLDDEFKKVFEKFNFSEFSASEENDKIEGTAVNAASNKKANSDSEEEEHEDQQKEQGGISNKKKKLQRRMKIAELKQISSRPDVVEVWDATSADPKLLVFLKSYRNTVPVPRHWCQKRKFLQGVH